MTMLLFLAAPIVLLFIARLYAAAHSNPTKTTAEALVRWPYILAWFMGALAAGADYSLTHYRRRRWADNTQPECEGYRPWPVPKPEEPRAIAPSMSIVARVKRAWAG